MTRGSCVRHCRNETFLADRSEGGECQWSGYIFLSRQDIAKMITVELCSFGRFSCRSDQTFTAARQSVERLGNLDVSRMGTLSAAIAAHNIPHKPLSYSLHPRTNFGRHKRRPSYARVAGYCDSKSQVQIAISNEREAWMRPGLT